MSRDDSGRLIFDGQSNPTPKANAVTSTGDNSASPARNSLGHLVFSNAPPPAAPVAPTAPPPPAPPPKPSFIRAAASYVGNQAKYVVQHPVQAAKNVGNTLISSEKNLGEDIAAAATAPHIQKLNDVETKRISLRINDLLNQYKTTTNPAKKATLASAIRSEQANLGTVANTDPTLSKSPLQVVADVGGTALDLATAGVGGAELKAGKEAVQAGAKATVKQVLKTTAKEAALGGTYGAVQAAQQKGATVKDIAKSAGIGAVIAPVAGTVLKGAGKVIGKLLPQGADKTAAELPAAVEAAGKTVTPKPTVPIKNFNVSSDAATFDKQRAAAKAHYGTIGTTELTGPGKENAGMSILAAQADTSQGKAAAAKELAAKMDSGHITPNPDGTITVYRGGDQPTGTKLVSVSTNKDAAAAFGPVKEYKVSPDHVAVASGLDSSELLVNKDALPPEKAPVAPVVAPETAPVKTGEPVAPPVAGEPVPSTTGATPEQQLADAQAADAAKRQADNTDALAAEAKPSATPAEVARQQLDEHVQGQAVQHQAAQDTLALANDRLDNQVGNLKLLIQNEEKRSTGSDITKIKGLDHYTEMLRDATGNPDLTTNDLVDYIKTLPTQKDIEKLKPVVLEPSPTTKSGEKKVTPTPYPKTTGTGEAQPSRAYQRVKDALPTADEGTNPTFKTTSHAQDAKNAVDNVNKNFEKVVQDLRSGKLPTNTTFNTQAIAAANEAADRGNFELQAELETRRSLALTQHGKEISSNVGVGENTPSGALDKVIRDNISAVKAKTGKDLPALISDRKKALSGSFKADTIKGSTAWSNVLDKLAC